jgi:O-antigen ligase
VKTLRLNRPLRPRDAVALQNPKAAQDGSTRFFRNSLLAGAVLLVIRLTLLQRQRQNFASVDSSATMQIVIVGLMGLLLVMSPRVLLMLWRRLAFTSGRLLLPFYVLCVASAIWSSMHAYSAFRAVEFAIQTLALFTLLAYSEEFVASERIIIRLGLAITIVEMLGLVAHYGFSRESLHSNSYSASAAMLFCYSFGEWLKAQGQRRLRLCWVAGFSLFCVVLGQSFASWLAILLGAGIALLTSRRHRVFALMSGGFLLVMVLIIPGTKKIIFMPNGAEEKVENLNGRRSLWEHYYALAIDKPFLGYGYAVSARTQGPFYATNTHNIVFATMLGTGLAGMLILCCTLVRGAIEAACSVVRGKPGSIGCLCALSGGLVNGLSISLICETWMPPSFVFVLFYGFHLFQVVKAPKIRGSRMARPLADPSRHHMSLVPQVGGSRRARFEIAGIYGSRRR